MNHPELEQMISDAVAGLSLKRQVNVRSELLEHYHDAFDEHIQEGDSSEVAHQKAMARLGEAKLIVIEYAKRTALNSQFRRTAMYVIILSVCIWALLELAAHRSLNLVPLYGNFIDEVFNLVFPFALFLPIYFSFQTFKTLFEVRYDLASLSVNAISLGYGIILGIPLFLRLFSEANWEIAALICQLGMVLSASGFIVLAAQLIKPHRVIYKSRRFIQGTFVICAASLIVGVAKMVYLPTFFYHSIFYIIVFNYLLLCPLLASVMLDAVPLRPKRQRRQSA
jgi:hypothetical protein